MGAQMQVLNKRQAKPLPAENRVQFSFVRFLPIPGERRLPLVEDREHVFGGEPLLRPLEIGKVLLQGAEVVPPAKLLLANVREPVEIGLKLESRHTRLGGDCTPS